MRLSIDECLNYDQICVNIYDGFALDVPFGAGFDRDSPDLENSYRIPFVSIVLSCFSSNSRDGDPRIACLEALEFQFFPTKKTFESTAYPEAKANRFHFNSRRRPFTNSMNWSFPKSDLNPGKDEPFILILNIWQTVRSSIPNSNPLYFIPKAPNGSDLFS